MRRYRRLSTAMAGRIATSCSLILAGTAAAKTTEKAGQSVVKPTTPSTKVAFIADVHLQDIYGSIDGYAGPVNSKSHRPVILRSMASQLTSTRLFNENYFAFRAALEDLEKRGVRLVALPGDYTDNGQPLNVDGLKVILDEFSAKGMRFFLAPGNHDPNKPFDEEGGTPDMLGANGRNQAIYSPASPSCSKQTPPPEGAAEVICSKDVEELGYAGIMQRLKHFGYMPQAEDLYWESPFSSPQAPASYNLTTATQEAQLDRRQFEICYEGEGGVYKQPAYTHCSFVTDASYLVEPVAGVWLLSIDANVYRPKAESIVDRAYPDLAGAFQGSGDAGYNLVLSHKRHLLPWIASVTKRAKEQGKQLVAFSHFPLAEFYNGQSDRMSALFAANAFQMQRRPDLLTTQALAETGLTLHVTGHMHLNNTGVYAPSQASNDFLVNIQTPALGVFGAAYKLMTLRQNQPTEVETVALEQVPRFDELFEHYEQEWQQLKSNSSQTDRDHLWDHRILATTDYVDYTHVYFGELSRLRFLKDYWPCPLRQVIAHADASQLLIWSQLGLAVTFGDLSRLPGGPTDLATCGELSGRSVTDPEQLKEVWRTARAKAEHLASAAGMTLDEVAKLTAYDFYGDFHRTAYAGPFAFKRMSPQTLKIYQLLFRTYAAATAEQPSGAIKPTAEASAAGWQLRELMAIFNGLLHGQPSDHFMIDAQERRVMAVGD